MTLSVAIAQPHDSPGISRIFLDSIPYSLFAKLGLNFLDKHVVLPSLQSSSITTFKVDVDGVLGGFIIFAYPASSFYEIAARNKLALAGAVLANVFSHPFLIFELFSAQFIEKTTVESRVQPIDDQMELAVMAVKEEFRGKGLGKVLVEKAFEDFKSRKDFGFRNCVVKAEDGRSVNFYEKNGFTKVGTIKSPLRALNILNFDFSEKTC